LHYADTYHEAHSEPCFEEGVLSLGPFTLTAATNTILESVTARCLLGGGTIWTRFVKHGTRIELALLL
jgi:hypothetical protein